METVKVRHPAFSPESQVEVSLDEIVKLGAVDAEFFNRTFFPKTFRQPSPPMHRDIDGLLDNPMFSRINLQCFRGSAKTTKLRSFLARRVAYRVTRTALFIGGSETAASRSIRWLKNQVEKNKLYASTFGLVPGNKWTESELEIKSTIDGSTSYILAAGILSNVRGINFEDYRPDLIVCDDPLTDENVLTQEGREKVIDLLLGAIAESLAPLTEEPNAKLALLQTPLHNEDASMMAAKTSMWKTVRFPCWTRETEDLLTDEQVSSWEERFPTQELRAKKRDFFAIGKGHVFTREWEVRITSPANSEFMLSQLQFYTDLPKAHVTSALGIDPVPPPSEKAVKRNLARKDFEVLSVWSRCAGNYYQRTYEMNKGHNPGWTIAKTFELAARFNISYIVVETVQYQATLKWLLETEMKRRNKYYVVIPDPVSGNKSKFQKIVDTYGSLLQHGKLYVLKTHTDFISQFEGYPNIPHDDVIDSGGIALRGLINPNVELEKSDYTVVDESDYPDLSIQRGCP